MFILTSILAIITLSFVAIMLLLIPIIVVVLFFELKYCDQLITGMQVSLILMLYFCVLTMISCSFTAQCAL